MPEKRTDAGVSISGGNVVAGNIGGSGNTGSVQGPVNVGGADQERIVVALQELLTELGRLRTELAESSGADAEPGDVDDVIEALDKDEPDIERAGSRWERLYRRIPEGLRDLDTITRIVQLMGEVRGLAG